MSMRSFHSNIAVDKVAQPAALVDGILPAVYLDMSDFDFIVFLLAVGVMAAPDIIDMKVVQATDSAGAGSKDVTSALITQLVDGDDGEYVSIEVRGSALDVDNAFRFVAVDIQITGTAIGSVQALRYRGGGLPPTLPAAYSEQVQVS